jgi:MraZ protein
VGQGTTGSAANSPVFRGVTHLALDTKGRLAIPAKYRDALAATEPVAAANGTGSLILTVDPSHCLLLFPRATWEPIEARLNALSAFDGQTRSLQRRLVGYATDVDLDGAGRILVSPELRQYAGLEHRVVLVGLGSKFELWDEARWAEQMAQPMTFAAGTLPPGLEGFSL